MMESWSKGYPIIISQALHWGDMDAFQHVNNKVYFRFFEDVRLAYLEQIGALDLMESTHAGPVLASTHCDFRAPLRYPDTVHIASRVHDLQPKRASMDYLVFSEQQQKVVAEGTSLMVYFDFKTGVSTDIPASIVAKILTVQQE